MSMFLPEGPGQGAPPSGVADITPGNVETTQADVALMQRVFAAAMTSPNLIPDGFMAYLLDWIQTQRLSIPIGQVFGFSQFTATVATPINTSEATAVAAYGDNLTTHGPTLQGLSDGEYLLIYGAAIANSAGAYSYMSPSVNGSTPVDNDAAVSASALLVGAIGFSVQRLAGGSSNTVNMEYRSGAGTATFQYRRLLALRMSN